MRDDVKNALKTKNKRKEGTDFWGNTVIVGDFIAFNEGSYRGKTIISLGIVCGFTDKSARVISERNGRVKTVPDEKVILYDRENTLKLNNISSEFKEIVNLITLPKKMEIL